MTDGIFVINVGGYIGSSTRSEIEYTKAAGRPVRYLVETPPKATSQRFLFNKIWMRAEKLRDL